MAVTRHSDGDVPPARVDMKDRLRPVTHWVAVVAVVCVIYYPAINRVFVMDQVWYFAELQGDYSLANGLGHYDYGATRRYWKGDEALFRPLLFAWLAVATWLLSYHHIWWNIANLALHAAVGAALYHLLVTIRPSPFALPAALLFVAAKTSVELVVWNHLGGYLIASLLLLIGAAAFVRLVRADGGSNVKTDAALYAVAFGAAALFYEAMVPISLLGALIVCAAGWRRSSRPPLAAMLVLLSPTLSFLGLYFLHAHRVARLAYVDRPDVSGIFDPQNLAAAVPASLEIIGRWAIHVALPAALQFETPPFARLSQHFVWMWDSPLHLLNGLAVAVMAGTILWTLSRRHVARTLPPVAFFGSAILAMTGIICLGRPKAEVVAIAYYVYPFGLLAVPLAYAVIDLDRLRTRAMMRAFSLALAILIGIHAVGAAELARQVGRINDAPSSHLRRISAFVDAHRAEADFSFAVEEAPEVLDPEILLLEGYPDDPSAPRHVRRLTAILFAGYYDERDPKYVVGVDGSARLIR